MLMNFNCQKDVLAILGSSATVHFTTTSIFAILKVLMIVIPIHFAITDALQRAVARTIADKVKSVKNYQILKVVNLIYKKQKTSDVGGNT